MYRNRLARKKRKKNAYKYYESCFNKLLKYYSKEIQKMIKEYMVRKHLYAKGFHYSDFLDEVEGSLYWLGKIHRYLYNI